ncbi:hypothetical protein B7R22_17230 [Subtercola boreus]|uniref:Uncharacterized protein n=2 Tax=Subtercola boreus TaxID=120213 RepID=A0A3E0VR42_9MICO|nr:hypothetical protein B7R22_17230 [Subtercola boreus]
MQELRQLVESIVRSAPAGYTSISRGGLEIRSPEGFYVGGAASAVIDGLLQVLGRLELTGVFILTGDTTASGNWVQSGSFRLTGPFTVEGATSMTGNFTSTGEFTLTGAFHINGATDLNGTMTVFPSGKIIIDGPTPMVIENGQISLGSAQLSAGVLGGMTISIAGGPAIGVSLLGFAAMTAGGESAGIGATGLFQVTGKSAFNNDVETAKDLEVGGLIRGNHGLQVTFMGQKSGVTPNIWRDPIDGTFWEVVP